MNTATGKKIQSNFCDDDERWDAVVRRDPLADGAFVYSVQSTGIYCRPSCPSRQAKRENVRFHATCATAEAAGFRACKRCSPNVASASLHAAAIERACRALESAVDGPDLAALAEAAGMSRFHFQRVFKSLVGMTPGAYAIARRAQRLREELPSSTSVTAAMYDAGFGSSGRLYADATTALGMTPAAFRNGGRGTTIRFAVGECSLGAILVASTDKGVCAILMGADPEPLLRDLQDRFHAAQLIGGDADFEQLVAKVVAYVEAPATGWTLPLDVQGTVFQQRVWRALAEIPPGTTVSYTELAQRIGAPSAVRAVASACAANFIAVAIPCHRVVRNDGALSGYRWGVERKRALLDLEAGAASDRT